MTDEVIFCETPDDVADAAAELIFEKQTEAVAERGVFRIALSGGTTPKLLYERLASSEWRDEMAWENWEVYWSDERAVPTDHPDSNYQLAHTHLLKHVPVRNIFRMDTLPFREGEGGGLEDAAHKYEQLLITQFGEPLPVFDVILLGMGADGHTASIFPSEKTVTLHSPQEALTTPQSQTRRLESTDAHVTAIEVMNQKIPHRLTLTYRALNAARTVIFLITGADKAKPVRDVLEHGDPALPATHVKPEDGECFWILDAAAAHLLE